MSEDPEIEKIKQRKLEEMLGYGIVIIMLNIGMYFVAPAMVLYGIKKAKLVKF